ncbi:MAG: thiol:disulfide interchange protein DsbA/DsbL [Gammaproteobacteria bacterium]|nr:thiol:disulfide interchange protein DsbA/DsbL [Gammaproteobacteria bacterium]NNF49818.1 thiol:disulfide interchange protein DsbA/DsbL [Woeseiaceae bacterium]MBT8094573.1 thiol:disulfide interchange protein DsbA/DsbL [Gammaproteobacteria bacterium]MBT8105172.1 thiol:disulfide interchange protein DsbA/DsbL [Gammaproteobacteria bacterium]NNK25186.1 thiol:disulfide interchange protein DsbA/DsbL [Woeseiaceae bacterium]
MKNLFVLFAVSLLFVGCGNKQDAEPETMETTRAEAAATEAASAAVEEPATEQADEVLQVVEESAADEAESEDEVIKLAMATDPADAVEREWKYREGVDYFRLVPAQPTIGSADRIEVSEFFMYSCPHCFTVDAAVEQWSAGLDPAVRFMRVPAIFNRVAQTHAQAFFAAELLASNGTLGDLAAFHNTVFVEFHNRGNRLLNKDAVQKLFDRFGVPADAFEKAWTSFPVDQKMRVAADLVRRYGVNAVPAFVVNGKYRVPNTDNVLDIVDELLVREGLR